MIDILAHRRILLNVLKDIYKNTAVASWLGFKGGTCLYFFHGLPRFSTDIDFNLLIEEKDFQPEKITKILEEYITLKDFSEKRQTWFWMGSYSETHQNVKVEISKRTFPDEYEILDLYGLSVQCLQKDYLFAHKLCAISERKVLANRDLFDAHFMFKKQFGIADEIIKLRTGLNTADYLRKLARDIPKQVSKRGVLDGLGDVLDVKQKKWAKENLIEELLFYLRGYGG